MVICEDCLVFKAGSREVGVASVELRVSRSSSLRERAWRSGDWEERVSYGLEETIRWR